MWQQSECVSVGSMIDARICLFRVRFKYTLNYTCCSRRLPSVCASSLCSYVTDWHVVLTGTCTAVSVRNVVSVICLCVIVLYIVVFTAPHWITTQVRYVVNLFREHYLYVAVQIICIRAARLYIPLINKCSVDGYCRQEWYVERLLCLFSLVCLCIN